MKLSYFVVASKVFLDNETLEPVVVNPLDSISIVLGSPQPEDANAIPLEHTILTVWRTDERTVTDKREEFSLTIGFPWGDSVTTNADIVFAGQNRFLHRMRFEGLRFKGPGTYSFVVQYCDEGVDKRSQPWLLEIQSVESEA